MRPLWDERYTPADADVIKKKARKMAGHSGYRASDVEDIEQDLAMHVFQRTHRHRPERAPRERFINKVAKNKLLNLIEAKMAQKRNNQRDISVDDADDGISLDETGAPARIDLQLDVREVLERMPKELRQIADLRMAGHSERELEGLLGLTRAQVRSRLQRIAELLSDAHLEPEKP